MPVNPLHIIHRHEFGQILEELQEWEDRDESDPPTSREIEQFRTQVQRIWDRTMPLDREIDSSARMEVGSQAVRVLIDGKAVFEYVHPDPPALLPTIKVGLTRRDMVGDRTYVSTFISWGHGCGWCDPGSSFTRVVNRDLQELAYCGW
jgi:hypothetical protein